MKFTGEVARLKKLLEKEQADKTELLRNVDKLERDNMAY